MKFKLEGSWYYAPVIFEEEDITVAVSTAVSIDGELSIWNEKEQVWEWLFLACAGYETNLEMLERYEINEEKRKMCTYKRGRNNVLFCKTDDYFYMGAGVIDLVKGKITNRYEWDDYYRCNDGKKLRDCTLSRYGFNPENGIMNAVDSKRKEEQLPWWLII